jgi:hypothetical protein
MNRIPYIRRFAGALAGLACALLALAAAAPAALAKPPPAQPSGPMHPPLTPGHVAGPVYKVPVHLPPGHIVGPVYKVPAPVPIHTVLIGGMPGWQIALIAIGAALLAATVAVLLDRTRAAHRKTITAAT